MSEILEIVPIDFNEAAYFVNIYHRHHVAPQGWKFGLGLQKNDKIVGVAIVGRPIARHLQDGFTLEVTRLCTDGTRNACSKLYSACWRATRAMGYRKLITYILASEKGISLKASGWKEIGKCGGGTWNRNGRPRIDKHSLQEKIRFEITPNE
jgi:hypothetical protein